MKIKLHVYKASIRVNYEESIVNIVGRLCATRTMRSNGVGGGGGRGEAPVIITCGSHELSGMDYSTTPAGPSALFDDTPTTRDLFRDINQLCWENFWVLKPPQLRSF
ncbi:hypothetical protein J6590_059826 [Homalodisca vitripennis]|nr:hypothetical protein J6590_059826 [Homalodisca vitripennis]